MTFTDDRIFDLIHCETCKDWGQTIDPADCSCPIPCPKCGRFTWPNLGVNMPAGAAFAIGSANVPLLLRRLNER